MPDAPRTKLLAPLAEAKEKVMTQLAKGREIVRYLEIINTPGGLLSLGAPKDDRQAKIDSEKWAKYTIDLLRKLFSDSTIAEEFGGWQYVQPSFGLAQVALKGWLNERIIRLESILERLELFAPMAKETDSNIAPDQKERPTKDIFVVHGHDEAAKHEVARFIEQLGLHPIILHEKADKGRTIIEKFEAHANVGFAVILLTPDDMGYPKDKLSEAKPRARQNVVLELGFFLGKLSRPRVCALLKGNIEIPTDYTGVLYKPMDTEGAWKFGLAKEIKAAGIDVDMNRLT
mgnify:FL=1